MNSYRSKHSKPFDLVIRRLLLEITNLDYKGPGVSFLDAYLNNNLISYQEKIDEYMIKRNILIDRLLGRVVEIKINSALN